MRPHPHGPVVALDLDGTSGDYHGHFTQFIELWTGKKMPPATAYTGGVPFHKWLGVSRSTYNDAKLAFRQGGWKRWMPAYEGIGEFTKEVRRNGVQVWICTTRPYLQLPTVDADTRHWLRRNGLQYDAVLYGPHKYRDLVAAVGRERVLVVYDDLPEQIDRATSLGLDAAIRSQPYNLHYAGNGRTHRASSVAEMQELFDLEMEEWRHEVQAPQRSSL